MTRRKHVNLSIHVLLLLAWAIGCGGAAEEERAGDGPQDEAGAGGGGNAESGGTSSGGLGSGGLLEEGGGAASGGAALGGSMASGGAGGDGSGGSGAGGQGTGGGSDCPLLVAGPFMPQVAQSAGFAGTDTQYSELYSDLCTIPADCGPPCVERGGTETFCAASVCIDSDDDYCLPPTKWRLVDGVLSPGTNIDSAAVTSLSLSNGDDHDLLYVEDFGFEIPADAEIVGISASVRKAKGSGDMVTDYVVSLLFGGEPGSANLGTNDEWPAELEAVEYGSMSELWGDVWTAAEINSTDFGVAIGALPGQNSGRAYVDAVEVSVYYREGCD